jgi:hypothetical protein
MAMLRRQWIAIIAVVVIAAGAGGLVIATTPTSYESGAVVAVLPSNTGNASDNPYFTSPEALAELASLTIQVMDSPQKRQDLQNSGISDYSVDNEGSSSSRSAAIFVNAPGGSPDEAAANTTAVVAATADELDQIQALSAINESARASIYTVVQPEPGAPNTGDRYKSGIAVALVVLLSGVIVVAIVDTSQRRRTEAHAAAAEPATRDAATD